MIETILIPPIPHLDTAMGRPYHLLLSHLLGNQVYFNFYFSQSMRGSYLILDNSAHEHQVGESISQVMNQAFSVMASEIVIPDHLFDYKHTVEMTKGALSYLSRHFWGTKLEPRLMFVGQGKTFEELADCVKEQVETIKEYWGMPQRRFVLPPVLGVSKDYHEMFEGGLGQILREIVIPCADEVQADIHLLGWCKTLWDVSDLSREFGDRIRTTDSARPYVYAFNGIGLEKNKPYPEYPHRQSDYFTTCIPNEHLPLMYQNIGVYDSAVKNVK